MFNHKKAILNFIFEISRVKKVKNNKYYLKIKNLKK